MKNENDTTRSGPEGCAAAPLFGFVVMSKPRFFNWHEEDGRGSLDHERLENARIDYLWTNLSWESRWRWGEVTQNEEVARKNFHNKCEAVRLYSEKNNYYADLVALWEIVNGKPVTLLGSNRDDLPSEPNNAISQTHEK